MTDAKCIWGTVHERRMWFPGRLDLHWSILDVIVICGGEYAYFAMSPLSRPMEISKSMCVAFNVAAGAGHPATTKSSATPHM
jgi:hypothetical protein